MDIIVKIRRSPIFMVILAVAVFVVFVSLIQLEWGVFLLSLSIFFVLIFGLTALYCIRCYFIFEEHSFVYVIGFQRKSIPYDSILSISLSEDTSAAPAWTLTRLEFISAGGRVLLSLPAKEDTPRFLDEIKRRAPSAKIELQKLAVL